MIIVNTLTILGNIIVVNTIIIIIIIVTTYTYGDTRKQLVAYNMQYHYDPSIYPLSSSCKDHEATLLL